MMRDSEKGLEGLIREVMEQMQKRKYGKKILIHYRSSFDFLTSISQDIGEKQLSERLIETLLGSPVSCEYYVKTVPLFRRNGYRESGTGIPHLVDCYLRVYSLNTGSNPYTSRMDL